MNPLFARQLRRRLGVDQPESVAELLRALTSLIEAAAPGTAQAALVRQLPHFFDTVEQTYAQNERDQALRNRSMAISSAELSEANQRLRESSARQQAVIDAMRTTADGMLVAAGKAALAVGETSLESLSNTVVELVRDREETRRRLAESETRFRALTAISSDWYWEQDDELRYVFVSAGAASVMSSADGFMGLRRWETEGARIGARELAQHKAELTHRLPFRDFEYQLQGADGQLRWVSTSGDPLIDADGRFRGYRGTGKDITERKRSQAQIAENLRLIEALLESIPDAIAIRSPHGATLRVNAAFQRLFAPMGDSLVGDTELPAVLGSPEQHAAEGRLLRTGGTHRCQVQFDADGNQAARVFLVQRAAFSGDDGAIAGLVITLTDVSELEQTRRQAISAQRTAEHAMKVRSQFLANMSHEVRTPMNGVLGIAGMLLDTPLNDSQRELACLLQTSGRALLTILNDILDFSKIEAGKVSLQIDRVRSARGDSRTGRAVCRARARPGTGDSSVDRRTLAHAGDGRSDPAGPGAGQSDRQCAQVHSARTCRGQRRAGGRTSQRSDPHRRARHRHGSRSVSAGEDIRRVFAGRRQHHPALRRHRAGAGDQPRSGRHHGRRDRRGQRTRGRQPLLVHGSTAARATERWSAGAARVGTRCASRQQAVGTRPPRVRERRTTADPSARP
ncbi:MAG: PAS domain S-box protein [Burkholderiaceae bacterium]|nr:PAS domain S-box protein [Burkholderiaceae bacterium]